MAGNKKKTKSTNTQSGSSKAKKASSLKSVKPKPKKEMRKTKLLNEIIEISSSCPDSTIKINEKDKRDNASQASTPKFKVSNADSIEDIKVAFNNIANMIVGSNPSIKFSMSLEGIPVAFKPPIGMHLDQVDTAATYIFMVDDGNEHGDEILAKYSACNGDRKTLKTLMPKSWVDQEVLNLLAHRLTYIENLMHKNSTTWFLPTMFSQYALDWGQSAESLRGYFQSEFMGKLEYVRKIFVPINDEGVHWYLMIVDLHQQKLLILDSLPCPERQEYRMLKVHRLAIVLQEMLMHESFYALPRKYKHAISTFSLVVPRGIGHQLSGSNDCGVWVAQWMKRCSWNDAYNQIMVCPSTRMCIALDLVTHPYNEVKDKVVGKAFEYWTDLEKMRKKMVKF